MLNGTSGARVHVLCFGCLSWHGHSSRMHFWETVLPPGMVAGDGRRELPGLDEEMFFEVLIFHLSNGYFRYSNTFYLQIQGTEMESPLLPIVAEVVWMFCLFL